MGENEAAQGTPPGPDPALKRLEMFVGRWEMKGRTLDSEQDNVSGKATFEWLPGGFFLQQRSAFDFVGMRISALEVIGYDPERDVFPSTVYASMLGVPIPYEYDVQGDDVTITTEFLGAKFTGKASPDGKTFSGGWRPMRGREGAGNVAYDVMGTRIS